MMRTSRFIIHHPLYKILFIKWPRGKGGATYLQGPYQLKKI